MSETTSDDQINIEDEDVVRRAREIATVRPDPADTDRVLANVRTRLLSKPTANRTWRLVMRGTIAASIVVTLATVAVLNLPRQATAAELLKDVVEAQAAYKGWVHVTTSLEGSDIRTTRHVNTDDHTVVLQNEQTGRKSVSHQSLKTGLWQTWNDRTNEIRVQASDDSGEFRRDTDPLTLDEAMRQIHFVRGQLNSPDLKVARSKDGEFDRFDVTPSEAVGGDPSVGLREATIWVEPKTKLIRRMRITPVGDRDDRSTKVAVAEVERSYTYGPPEFPDIYAAGVPRDAAVIDMRPDKETADVIAKVRAVIAPPLGDYVAIVTQSGHTPDGKDVGGGNLRVIGRKGKQRFEREFWVKVGGDPKTPGWIEAPAGWPMPRSNDVLAAIKGKVAEDVTIGDRESSRRWQIDPQTRKVKFEWQGRISGPDTVFTYVYTWGWELLTITPNTRYALVADDARPGLKGIRRESVLSTQPLTPGAKKRDELDQGPGKVIWVDPAKRWVPVAHDDFRPVHTAEGKKWPKQVTVYEEFGKLADGTPYPTKWSEPSHWPGMPRHPLDKSVDYTVDYRVRIEQRPPEDAWFEEPVIDAAQDAKR